MKLQPKCYWDWVPFSRACNPDRCHRNFEGVVSCSTWESNRLSTTRMIMIEIESWSEDIYHVSEQSRQGNNNNRVYQQRILEKVEENHDHTKSEENHDHRKSVHRLQSWTKNPWRQLIHMRMRKSPLISKTTWDNRPIERKQSLVGLLQVKG